MNTENSEYTLVSTWLNMSYHAETAQATLLGLAGPAVTGLLVPLAWVPKAITIIFQPNTPTISNLQTTKCRCWAQKVCAMAYCSIFCRDSAWFIVTQWWCLSAPKQLDDCFILSQNPYLRSLCKRLRERSNRYIGLMSAPDSALFAYS